MVGLVRGFSGFCTPMVYMLPASAVYEPRVALVHMLVFGRVATLPSRINSQRRCVWREIVPLLVGAVIIVPDGVRLRPLVGAITLRARHCCLTTVVLTDPLKSA